MWGKVSCLRKQQSNVTTQWQELGLKSPEDQHVIHYNTAPPIIWSPFSSLSNLELVTN